MSETYPYFDIRVGFPAISVGEVFEVGLVYELKGYREGDLRVRVANPLFCIVDEVGVCIRDLGTWDSAPGLRDTYKIMVAGNFDLSIPLVFEIQNIRTGEVYKTPERFIWKRGVFSDYPLVLNQKVLSDPPTAIANGDGVAEESTPNVFLTVAVILIVLGLLALIVRKMIKSHDEHT